MHKHKQDIKTAPRRRKSQPDPYTSKIIKKRSEHEQDVSLRHAVRTKDYDSLEDWDEPEH